MRLFPLRNLLLLFVSADGDASRHDVLFHEWSREVHVMVGTAVYLGMAKVGSAASPARQRGVAT